MHLTLTHHMDHITFMRFALNGCSFVFHFLLKYETPQPEKSNNETENNCRDWA